MRKAVLTGDIVNFTKVKVKDREVLVKDTRTLFDLWPVKKGGAKFFRGDSFQLLFDDIAVAIFKSIQLRCWFKKMQFDHQKINLDAKISIGIGDVSYFGTSVLDADGEAFHLSGRTFDEMEEARLRIVIGDEKINKQLEIVADLMDVIINNWTSAQAEVIYWLLQDKTQQQIADELGIVQSAVNNRIRLAKWKEIEKTLNYLSSILK